MNTITDSQILFALAVVSPIFTALASWFAVKQSIAVSIARLEEKHNALKEDVDSDHARLERLSDFVHKVGGR